MYSSQRVKPMNIAFRVDGGIEIGMGHVMRCISLAKEFKNAGCAIYFFSRIQEGINKISDESFNVIRLAHETSSNDIGISDFYWETSELIRLIAKYDIELLIVDTYLVDEMYFQALRPHLRRIAYIDDLNRFVYPVDILINGNLTGEYEKYIKYSDNELMLLGLKYNLIRDEFRNLPKRIINHEVKEIMITTGGTDPYHLSLKIAQWILRDEYFKNIKLNVVIGGGFKNIEQLEELSKHYSNLVLYQNVKYMSEIMLCSDIAISAGGSTLYELCACGTPALALIMADNQEQLVQKFDELGYMQSLGWYHQLKEKPFINQLKSLCNDYNRRCYLANQNQKVVDGYGTQRVAREILARAIVD